jgi:hypothetical protein
MIKMAKVTMVAVLLAVTPLARVNAQTNRTSVLLNLTFNLTSYEQTYLESGTIIPSARTAKVNTASLITAIAKDAHITGDMSTAKLYWRLSWIGTNGISSDFIIRKGTNDYLVGGDSASFNYFLISFPDKVATTRANLNGTITSTDFANCNVSLGTSSGSFTLHGIATRKSSSLLNGKTVIDLTPFTTSFTASVAGSGSISFHQAEWKGTVMGSGQLVEIVPDSE